MIKRLFLILFVFAVITANAGHEEKVVSLSGNLGKPIVNAAGGSNSLSLQDFRYNYMQANTSWPAEFFLGEHKSRVVLRYDDSKRYPNPEKWGLQVTYDVVAKNENGIVVANNTGESLEIFYDPNEGVKYTDIAIKEYPGAMQTDVKITCVKYLHYNAMPVNNNSVTAFANVACATNAPLPEELNDVYFELEQHTDRYYNINPLLFYGTVPSIKIQQNFTTVQAANNTLPIAWNFIPGAESFDLEWLFVDAPNQDIDMYGQAYNVLLNSVSSPYDFSNATRVNLSFNSYEIPMSYSSGILLYRVRAVGYRVENINGTWTKTPVNGMWSNFNPAYPAGTVLTNLYLATGNVNTIASNTNFRFDFIGQENDLTWQYASTYAEDGKRKEIISYFDGSLRNRQTATLLNSSATAVVAENKFDYEGRPAVQIMPVPLSSQGIKFYSNFNPGFSKPQFDEQSNVNNPSPLGKNDQANIYYGQNNQAVGFDAYVPNAEGFAYSRTSFTTDGTNRVRKQSGVGINHKMGSGHETRYYYGHPQSQDELDELFGNEVGSLRHYQKNMVADANGQLSVVYLDQEGRTIATCISGSAPQNLIPIDNRPAEPPVTTKDILTGNDQLVNGSTLQDITTVMVDMDQQYVFEYNLGVSSQCTSCLAVNQATSCADCKYDVDISLVDEDGLPVPISVINTTSCSALNNTFSCKNVSSGNIKFSAMLKVGKYILTKNLVVSKEAFTAVKNTFIDVQNQSHNCVQIPAINPESCDYGCKSMCEQQYRVFTTNGVTKYYDENGLEITFNAYQSAINNCIANCNEQTLPTPPSECEVRYNAILTDMMPGGQYMDNIYDKYIYGSTGSLVLNPNYNIDGFWSSKQYTIAMVNTTINAYITPSPGVHFTSFNDLRNNWKDAYAPALLGYHPEYRIYLAQCGNVSCFNPPDINTKLHIYYVNPGLSLSAEFDKKLNMVAKDADALANNYFNLTSSTNLTSSFSITDLNNGNSNYCPTSGNTNASYIGYKYDFNAANTDPFVKDGICKSLYCLPTALSNDQFINNYLHKYLRLPSGNYLSIWYVIDDPLNIHLATVNSINSNLYNLPSPNNTTTVDASIYKVFAALHGDGTPNSSGLFKTGGIAARFKFYNSVYQFYKKLLIYKANQSAFPYKDSDMDGFSETNVNGVQKHYQIRIPRNKLFENMLNSGQDLCTLPDISAVFNSSASSNISTEMHAHCQTECANSADSWMSTINPVCANLSATDKINLKAQLISLCEQMCESKTNPSVTVNGVVCTSFDAIMDRYTPNCNSTLVKIDYPEKDYSSNNVLCACKNLNQAMDANSTVFPSGQAPHPASESELLAALNAAWNSNYSSTTFTAWKTTCALAKANPTTHTNVSELQANGGFPDALLCETPVSYNAGSCSCDNLRNFYYAFGYTEDSLAANYPRLNTVLTIITAHLNNAFKTAITTNNLIAMLNECKKAQPALATLNNNSLPTKMACPEIPANATDAVKFQTIATASCMKSNLEKAMNDAAKAYYKELLRMAADVQNAYYDYCLNNAKQTFTMACKNYLYLYTLYYYDQAGNLIKTVPPEGVQKLSAADIVKVANYRKLPYNYTPVYPAHRLVTNYKYNSLNQLIEQSTPDGGLSYFWYDAKGRLVVSQNAKQRAHATSPYNAAPYLASNKAFSYTLYDKLGRIYEVGEVDHPVGMNYGISRHVYDASNPTNNTINNDLFTWLDLSHSNSSINKFEVTSTVYGNSSSLASLFFGMNGQQNLRNRIVSTSFEAVHDYNTTTFDHINQYSYDIHGNVKKFVGINNRQNNSAAYVLDYEYDLISGNVNALHKNSGTVFDEFHHRYYYDADNRLTSAYSSTNGRIWEKEAKYFYYAHGPLARTEIGDKQVAGNDHVYTLSGWIKGVNSNYLNPLYDVGTDGLSDAAHYHNLNGGFATDAAGYTLGYFTGDYKAKNTSQAEYFETTENYGGTNDLLSTMANYPYTLSNGTTINLKGDLFNGNISRMVTALTKPDQSILPAQARGYFYDQLNRIKLAKDFEVAAPVMGINQKLIVNVNSKDNYYEDFAYDFNGNITHVNRFGLDAQNLVKKKMDEFRYNYVKNANGQLINNKLQYVQDNTTLSANFADDIDDQNVGNYVYDEIGNLIKDNAEKITDIKWNVYGKINTITYANTTAKSDLEFRYNAAGQRVEKIEKTKQLSGTTYIQKPANQWKTTYYQRDPQGNVITVYTQTPGAPGYYTPFLFTLSEQHIYGSSRLGTFNPNTDLTVFPLNINKYQRDLGDRRYEFTNHLGNVLTVISDKRLFSTRKAWHAEESYEGSFQGMLNHGAHVDGISSQTIFGPYGNSPYTFSKGLGKKRIEFGDVINASIYSMCEKQVVGNTGELVLQIFDSQGQSLGWRSEALTNNPASFTKNSINSYIFTPSSLSQVGVPPYYALVFAWNTSATNKVYVDQLVLDITHNGNLNELDAYKPDVISSNDYYSFGSPMPGRQFNSNSYRYGFNGKEKDNEINVDGGDYDFGARIYDSRIGRFLALDPLIHDFPSWTPYQYAANSPISFIDEDGMGPKYKAIAELMESHLKKKGLTVTKVEFSEIRKEIVITASFAFKGKNISTTFTYNEKTNDRDDGLVLSNWGVDYFDVAIAESDNFLDKASHRMHQLEHHYQKFENGGMLAFKTAGTVVTMGSWFEIEKAVSVASFFAVLDGCMILNDLSTSILGPNKTFLVDKCHFSEEALTAFALCNDAAQFVTGVRELILNSKTVFETLKKEGKRVDPSVVTYLDTMLDQFNAMKDLLELMEQNNKSNQEKKKKEKEDNKAAAAELIAK